MNAHEFAARLHNRLLPKARSESDVLYDFMVTLRRIVEENRRDWERWRAEQMRSCQRAQDEGWGQTFIEFHAQTVEKWDRLAATADALRGLNRDNADALLDRVIGALMAIDGDAAMLQLYVHIAMNECHLFYTETGQYDGAESEWGALMTERWNQAYERYSADAGIDETVNLSSEEHPL